MKNSTKPNLDPIKQAHLERILASGKQTEFLQAFLSLLMCSDPSPVTPEEDKILRDEANKWSRDLGFENWIEAYHYL